jgi:hypothetical protein
MREFKKITSRSKKDVESMLRESREEFGQGILGQPISKHHTRSMTSISD